MVEALFTLDGDEALVGPMCRGPWDADAAHFGPPAALLGRAVERAPGGDGKRVARLAFDVLSPVPLGRVRIEVDVIRPGSRVDLVEARLIRLDNARLVAAVRAWRHRRPTEPLHLPDVPGLAGPPTPVAPEGLPEMSLFRPPDVPGYHVATQWVAAVGDTLTPGPATAWCRLVHPLIADEEPTPLQRVLVAADSTNGLSAVARPEDLLFVNTDLTVHLDRDPVGEWIGVDAVTSMHADGGGTATGSLFDRQGAIGRATQCLFVAPPR